MKSTTYVAEPADRPDARRGRPRGSRSRVSELGFNQQPLNRAHANFVNAVLQSSGSSLRVADAARQYVPALADGLTGTAVHALARQIYRAFIHAGAMRAEGLAVSISRAQPDLVRPLKSEQTALLSTLEALRAAEPHASWSKAGQQAPEESKLPSLEEWLASYESEHPHVDLSEFGESELLAMYCDEFGLNIEQLPSPSSVLVEPGDGPVVQPSSSEPNWAQLGSSFISMATELCVAPTASDACGRWLLGPIAANLKAAGVMTLGDLVGYISTHGPQWWRPAPRSRTPRAGVLGVGPIMAAGIAKWLQEALGNSGQPVLPPPEQSPRKRGSAAPGGSEPSSRYGLGFLLDAHERAKFSKRRWPCAFEFTPTWPALEADLEAAQAWLRAPGRPPATTKAYVIALERYFLWCSLEHQRTPSELHLASIDAFKTFIQSPPPHWVFDRWATRQDSSWRPLRRPLSTSSANHNARIVRSFLLDLPSRGTGEPG